MTQCFEEEHTAIAPGFSTSFSTAQKNAPEEERWPTTCGSSSGRWDGDTLIETLSVRHPAPTFRCRLRFPNELAMSSVSVRRRLIGSSSS